MSTIPLTFDEHQINRTVIGGYQNKIENALNISVILLNNSSSSFKLTTFENLLNCHFQSIVSVEHDVKNFQIDDLSKKYPQIKFIIPLENASDGELINLAMSEIQSDYALVLRDDLYIPSGIILPHLAERLLKEDCYCLVPRLTDRDKNGISTQFVPSVDKSHFAIESLSSCSDGSDTLYPFDFIGFYNRKKFIQLGGFDYTIKTPYWQNLDLSLRAWLWGEKIKLTTLLQFSYIDECPIADKTANLDYLRYYLKNEMPKFKSDSAYIKALSFFTFKNHSSCGFLEAKSQFNSAKKWVEQNRFRFKKDLQMFIENWGRE